MKKAAIYARVSTDEQKKNYSIGEQIRQLEEYCERRGWEVAEEYVDSGFSGSNMNRPALKQMLQEDNYYDVVVVWKLDRLSRSIVDTMTIIEQDLIASGVQFIALAENIDTESSTWITQAGIYSTIAQSEREAITERMQMGKLARAKSGKPMSWVRSPFGYQYNKESQTYDIVPLEADIVRGMFKRYEQNKSVTGLRNELNDAGYIAKDVKWSYRTVKQVLDNPVYIGYNRYKGKRYKGNHEPLISEELFNRVDQIMEERRIESMNKANPRPFQGKYMLSGQIKCGYCKAPLGIRRNTLASGEYVFRYQCVNRIRIKPRTTVYNDNRRCDSGIYLKEELEEKVLSQINELQLDSDLIHTYSRGAGRRMSELADYKKELSSNKKKSEKLIDLYMAELIDVDELNMKSEDLKREERYFENKITELEGEKNEALEYLNNNPDDIYSLSYEDQKLVVETLIDTIYVTSDNMDIHWAF